MAIYKLSSNHIEKPWGYEKWLLSCHPNSLSFVDNGESKLAPETIFEKLKEERLYGKVSEFPLLIKIIQADKSLSVQVHPDDENAAKDLDISKDQAKGKSECWFILEAEKEAKIIWGWKNDISLKEFVQRAQEKKLEEKLRYVSVKKGDFIYVPAGTVHAIGQGIKLLEVQQSSDITYRIYDYHRKRELHLNQAQHISDLDDKAPIIVKNFDRSFCTKHFTVQKSFVKNQDKQPLVSLKKNNWLMIFSLHDGLRISQKNGDARFSVDLNKEEAVLISKAKDTQWETQKWFTQKITENCDNPAHYITISE